MNETYNIQAIVLRRQAFKERDDRIVIYSDETGKKELVVRGTKKILSKLSGHIEPLSLVSLMVVRGKQYNYAGTVISLDCFQGIKKNYERVVAAGYGIKIFDEFVKFDLPDEELFALLKKFLKVIERVPAADAELLSDVFIFQFFQALGVLPDFKIGDYHGMKVSEQVAEFLALTRNMDLEKFTEVLVNSDLKKEINTLANYFVEIAREK